MDGCGSRSLPPGGGRGSGDAGTKVGEEGGDVLSGVSQGFSILSHGGMRVEEQGIVGGYGWCFNGGRTGGRRRSPLSPDVPGAGCGGDLPDCCGPFIFVAGPSCFRGPWRGSMWYSREAEPRKDEKKTVIQTTKASLLSDKPHGLKPPYKRIFHSNLHWPLYCLTRYN